jgi:hypothetical protein
MNKKYLFLIIVAIVFSCKKEETNKNTNTTSGTTGNNTVTPVSKKDWYIYEMYAKYDGTDTPINLMGNGPDYRLDFRADGSIYLYILSVPGSTPAFWGTYTNSTITLGSGGVGSIDFQIINQSSTILEAKKTDNGVSYFLTLKK